MRAKRKSGMVLAGALLIALRGSSLHAQAPMVEHSRSHNFVHDVSGPGALLGIAASASYQQWQKNPAEWGTGAEAFGKRAASAAGQLFAQEAVHHSLAALMHHSTQYERCGCGFGKLLGHAVSQALTDRNREGRRVVSVPRIAGAFAGAFTVRAWRPNYSNSDAALSGAMSLGWSAVGNIAKELIFH